MLITSVFGTGWIATVAFSLSVLLNYDNKPGEAGATPASWPASRFEHASDRPTLVMLAHPRCPCTRASIGELAKIMARLEGKITAYVLFVRPSKDSDEWEDSDLRRSAASIPGVTVSSDIDGVEAGRFGAETSGHTLLFGAEGRLLFNGGITQSRGHAGDNAGENAIISLVNNQAAKRDQTFVFGCRLVDRKAASGQAQ